jgi:hypothetical protein
MMAGPLDEEQPVLLVGLTATDTNLPHNIPTVAQLDFAMAHLSTQTGAGIAFGLEPPAVGFPIANVPEAALQSDDTLKEIVRENREAYEGADRKWKNLQHVFALAGYPGLKGPEIIVVTKWTRAVPSRN